MSSFKEKLNYVNKILLFLAKSNLSTSRSNSFYSNRLSNQKDINKRTNNFSIRKYSDNSFNRNNSFYSPNNTDRRSFNNLVGTEINDNLLRYRENSGKKFKTRSYYFYIKKL